MSTEGFANEKRHIIQLPIAQQEARGDVYLPQLPRVGSLRALTTAPIILHNNRAYYFT
jgi:hypothetical protein